MENKTKILLVLNFKKRENVNSFCYAHSLSL
nr:MAG TPA: hypothetical protein [Caudoviricetes sp.]